LISSDVERTVRFYQEILELSLTEVFENRDLPGSNHFFFDLGNGNAIAFFDLPGVDPSPYAEVLGGLHHLAISVEPERWKRLKSNLDTAGVEYAHARSRCTSVTSTAPGLELIADPLGEMYGSPVV
jgi:catechol 2,3-dioxygenase-like lactoylglutathione lyase family enzyme